MVDAKAAGLAVGILWGAAMLLVTVFNMQWGYGADFVTVFQGVYAWGYTTSWLGALVGGIYGFIDGFLAGFITVWLYNKFAK